LTVDELLQRLPTHQVQLRRRRGGVVRVLANLNVEEIRQRAIRRAGWLEGRAVRERLPMPRVWACGRRWRTLLTPDGFYDFFDDVRELVCDPIRHDVYAMWSDPREVWGR
jgi:hypothetical protein